jgi:surfeit locus 1 family protein
MSMIQTLLTGRRLWLTLLVVCGVALCARLGLWQWDRHQQRAAENARIAAGLSRPPVALDAEADPQALDYRPVEVRGVFDPSHEVLLRNRSLNGATGYHLITPLRLADGRAVLVDRGWVPLAADDPEQRAAFVPPGGVVTVTGVARRAQVYQGGAEDPPLGPGRPRLDAWFRVDVARIQEQVPYPLLPVFVQQQPAPGAPRSLPQPVAVEDLGPGSHLGYTFQWFSFGVVLLVGYFALMRRQASAPPANRSLKSMEQPR